MSETMLELDAVHMAFSPGDPVLDGVELRLEAGSVTGLLGRNGAGKTTLMRIAAGLDRPCGGTARIFGAPAFDAPAELRRRIGYVAQGPVTFRWLRIDDCLALVSSFYERWDDALVVRYLREWDLDPAARIGTLSAGQQQKVAILLAIGHRPDLLLLDEPVAALDPGARRQFLHALVELNADLDRTILFSTHITTDLERVAADVAVLHGGRIRYGGPIDALQEGWQRLRLAGDGLPTTLDVPGVLRYQRDEEGGHASAFVRDWSEARTAALARELGVRIDAAMLPLEELFLELTHDD